MDIQASITTSTHTRTLLFYVCLYLKYTVSFFFSSLTQTHTLLHTDSWPLSVECCHLCGVEWIQRSPLTARCMQLNRIKVISPTEVIAGRWLPCRNMLLMKLLSHYGCVLVCVGARVCVCCLNCNTPSWILLGSIWSFSCSITISAFF